jgi:hypothetical protein
VQSDPQRTSCNDAMRVGVVGSGPPEPEHSGGAKTNVVGTNLRIGVTHVPRRELFGNLVNAPVVEVT